MNLADLSWEFKLFIIFVLFTFYKVFKSIFYRLDKLEKENEFLRKEAETPIYKRMQKECE